MSEFFLEIMTPERVFFSGSAQALTVTLSDGLYTMLANHAPMVAVLTVGELLFKVNGEWKVCAASEGFLEVSHERVAVFAQACEYPDEIDAGRARAAYERAQSRLASSRSLQEHELTKIALSRAMNRLRVTGRSRKI